MHAYMDPKSHKALYSSQEEESSLFTFSLFLFQSERLLLQRQGWGLHQISAVWMNTFLSSTMQQCQGRKRTTKTAMLGYHSTTELYGVIPLRPTTPDLRSLFPHLDDCFHFQTLFDIVYFLRIYFAIKFHIFALNQI